MFRYDTPEVGPSVLSMSYWIEEDELDCVVLEGNDSDIMDSAKQKKHNAFVEEPFYCCICGMDISFFLKKKSLMFRFVDLPCSERLRHKFT